MNEMHEIPLDDHDPSGCHLCPACADKLRHVEAALDRLMPLADLLDQLLAAPGDGQVPSLFKVLGALRGS